MALFSCCRLSWTIDPFDRKPCAYLPHGEGAFVGHDASACVRVCADVLDGAHDAREGPSVDDDVATLVVAAAEVPAGDLCREDRNH